jgi:hypothetical protein
LYVTEGQLWIFLGLLCALVVVMWAMGWVGGIIEGYGRAEDRLPDPPPCPICEPELSGWVHAGNSTPMVSEDGVNFYPRPLELGRLADEAERYLGRLD